MKRLFLILCCLVIPFLVQAQQAPEHSRAGGRHLGQAFAEDFDVDSIRGQIPEAAIEHAKSVQKQHESEIMGRAGVIGIGVGTSSVDGVTPVIKVYVDNTSAGALLSLPSRLDSTDVEIVETDPFEAYVPVPPRSGLPALMGQSTSPVSRQYSGTLGFRAHRAGDPSVTGYVTNNHVAATDAEFCATAVNPEHIPPFQLNQCYPSVPDGGCTHNIGRLTHVVPLFMGNSFYNTVDAAFVESDHTLVSDDVVGIEPIRNANPLDPFMMLPVTKTGRTTGTTAGIVETINTTISVNYSCGTARFTNQAVVTPGTFAAPGDSGSSVWVNNLDPQLVGLLFAGSSSHVIINPISAVLGSLGVVPDFSGTSDEPPPNQVTVPNVVGMQEAAARTTIINADLVVGSVQYASNAAAAGTVFDQDPNGGALVNEGSAVNLWVSTGPGNVIVPNVIGMSEAAATTAIQNAGLVVSAISRVNNAAPAGTVIGQSPTGGTSVPPGSGVTLTISLGPGTVAVPNVINMSEAAATTAIQNAGLVVGTVTRVQNAAPAGTVIGQSPVGGTQVAPGSAVNLTVSLGSGGPVLQPVFVEAEAYSARYNLQTECGSSTASGGCNIAYIRDGSWSQYYLNFGTAPPVINHTYTLRFRYARWSASPARTVTVWDTYSGRTVEISNLPVTGGTQTYQTVEVPFTFTGMEGGNQTEIRFTYHGGSMNVDYIEFIP